MVRFRTRWLIGFLVTAGAAGCTAPPKSAAPAPAPEPFAGVVPPTALQAKAAKSAADSINDFAFDLASRVDVGKPGANRLVSPLGVVAAHSMLLSGTAGVTRDELADSLRLGKTAPGTVHDAMFAILYGSTRGGQLVTAGALFAFQPLEFQPRFARALKDRYDAAVFQFKDAGPDSVSKINEWVEDKTRGMIPKAVERLEPHTVFALAQATAFSGKWDEPFKASDTRLGSFHVSRDRVVSVPTMRAARMEVRAAMTDQTMAFTLDYASDEFMMAVLAPRKGYDAVGLLQSLTSVMWKTILGKLEEVEAAVSLPKFTFDASYDLVPVMKGMGAKRLFTPKAQLSGVARDATGAWVGSDMHLAHIEVDEQGTKAAAATVELTRPGEPSRPVVLAVDRPFLYAIVHRKTGVIAFLGICGDPTHND